MAKVTISFATDNAAFNGGPEAYMEEVRAVLQRAAAALDEGSHWHDGEIDTPCRGRLADSNGNTIGEWRVG